MLAWLQYLSLLSVVLFLPEYGIDARYVFGRGRRCTTPEAIANGNFRVQRGALMRVSCDWGYRLQGPRVIECVSGKWYGEKPICAKRGCAAPPESPANGQTQIENEWRAVLLCEFNYRLAGNRFAYCNGTHWDRPIGTCRLTPNNTAERECDFETVDLCGWLAEEVESYSWKRTMAANVFGSFSTGPRHDHTTLHANGGHYMLMESLGSTPTPVALTSPIYKKELTLKTACCFRFFYFMYGSGVGDLHVFVKPVSQHIQDMLDNVKYAAVDSSLLDGAKAALSRLAKFSVSGNQNNLWHEAKFDIEELEEDFNIVFVAQQAGRGHLSDIAIDDVKLMIGSECRDSTETQAATTTASSPDDENDNEDAIFDTQSCVSRCWQVGGAGYVYQNGTLFQLCSCDMLCLAERTCCPDFMAVCYDLPLETTRSDEEFTSVYGTTAIAAEQPKDSKRLTSTTTTEPLVVTATTPRTTTTTRKSTTIPKTTTTSTTTPRPTTTTTTTRTTPTTITTRRTTATTTRKSTATTTRRSTTTKAKASEAPTTRTESATNATLPQDIPDARSTTMSTTSSQSPAHATTSGVSERKEIINTFLVPDQVSSQYMDDSSVLMYMLILVIVSIFIVAVAYRYRDRLKSGCLNVEHRGGGGAVAESAHFDARNEFFHGVKTKVSRRVKGMSRARDGQSNGLLCDDEIGNSVLQNDISTDL